MNDNVEVKMISGETMRVLQRYDVGLIPMVDVIVTKAGGVCHGGERCALMVSEFERNKV